MADLKSLNGNLAANIKSWNGVAYASLKSWNGLVFTHAAAGATYGYFAGGADAVGTGTTAVDRITFSTGVTAASTASAVSFNGYGMFGCSDKVTYGYFSGGESTGGTVKNTGHRITFSTSATATNTASNLSTAKSNGASLSDGATYGYFGGGYSSAKTAGTDRITFSTGATAANTGSNLSEAKRRLAGLSDGANYGYWMGGTTNPRTPSVIGDRLTFSTSVTAANTVSNLTVGKIMNVCLSDGSTYGYSAGGITAPRTLYQTTERMTFSTGAWASSTTNNLATGRRSGGTNSDGTTYGYYAGGDTGAGTTVTVSAERITFSTGAWAANTVSNISAARDGVLGISDLAI